MQTVDVGPNLVDNSRANGERGKRGSRSVDAADGDVAVVPDTWSGRDPHPPLPTDFGAHDAANVALYPKGGGAPWCERAPPEFRRQQTGAEAMVTRAAIPGAQVLFRWHPQDSGAAVG
jgi:hypothetical protein